jgi:long-subunit acyl-CoA synthetase (AMP-forming)
MLEGEFRRARRQDTCDEHTYSWQGLNGPKLVFSLIRDLLGSHARFSTTSGG